MRSRSLSFFLILFSLAALSNADQSPVVPVIDKAMRTQLRSFYQTGNADGNRPDVFAKVGDSITRTRYFLKDIGCGVEVLSRNQHLAPTIEYFRQTTFPPSFTTAWCGNANSFSRDSVTSDNGWTAVEPLTKFPNPVSECPPPDDNPLRCELRLLRPGIALIMLGTNDLEEDNLSKFRKNLKRVVQETLIEGVVPVLSTIPPRLDSSEMGRRVGPHNQVIKEVAETLQVPLWNYWLVLVGPGMIHQGIDKKGIHPSVFNVMDSAVFTSEALRYGMNQRNLTALEVLKKLKAVIQGSTPADTTTAPNFAIYPTQLQLETARASAVTIVIKIARNNTVDPISLSLEAPPPGVTGTFQNNVSGTASTLTVQVRSAVDPGDYRITVRGTSGSLKRTTTFALNVTN